MNVSIVTFVSIHALLCNKVYSDGDAFLIKRNSEKINLINY